METPVTTTTTTETKPKTRRRDTNDVRAERKRELDRLAQRATRERTKSRIAFLEQKLASLESCDRQSTISQLTKTIDDLRNDNMRLQSAMTKMRFALNEALDGTEANTGRTCTCASKSKCTCQPKAGSSSSDTPRHESRSPDDDVVELPSEPPVPMQDGVLGMWPSPTNLGGLEEFLGFQPNSIPTPVYDLSLPENTLQSPWVQVGGTTPSMPTPPPLSFQLPPADGGPTLTIASDFEKWHVSNGAFIDAMDAVKKNMATNQTLDLHVPFRAGLWGWGSIPTHELAHPVWSALRAVDQKVFGTWATKPAQRIAVMYACQTMLQYREAPTKENLDRVPKYLLPRPSQQRIQHPAVIDYLVWPGLRDRLVFEHEKYTRTGDFSAAFVKYAHFNWPYSEREIFAVNPNTGQWEVSKLFLDHVYDFKNWTMQPEFFRVFPEMVHDIPAYGGQVQTAVGPYQTWGATGQGTAAVV